MIANIALVCLAIAGACAAYRVLRGPALADRVVALDVGLMCLMAGVAVDAAGSGSSTSLVLIVVIAVIGFTATVAASSFIERNGPGT
jgi:multicomponent Na+:H+ antiporter subunit F